MPLTGFSPQHSSLSRGASLPQAESSHCALQSRCCYRNPDAPDSVNAGVPEAGPGERRAPGAGVAVGPGGERCQHPTFPHLPRPELATRAESQAAGQFARTFLAAHAVFMAESKVQPAQPVATHACRTPNLSCCQDGSAGQDDLQAGPPRASKTGWPASPWRARSLWALSGVFTPCALCSEFYLRGTQRFFCPLVVGSGRWV